MIDHVVFHLKIALSKALQARQWDSSIDVLRTLRMHAARRGSLDGLKRALEIAEDEIMAGMREDRSAALGDASAMHDEARRAG